MSHFPVRHVEKKHRAGVKLGIALVTFKWQAPSVYIVAAVLCVNSPHNLFSLLLCPVSLSDRYQCPLSLLSPYFLSHSPITVCLLSCVLLQDSLVDVIYAISFASMRRSVLKPNALHAECSCGRLWASTDWAAPFLLFLLPIKISLHTIQ